MTLPLVILGSARSDGETRRAVDLAFPPGTAELVVLPNFSIGGYDYRHFNTDDAFGGIAPKMAEADKVVFATPVYWYAMS
ncbi:MAG TPA: NAD(P)H-dependent oxidoreductase, partial [Rhizomicrobium sp.]